MNNETKQLTAQDLALYLGQECQATLTVLYSDDILQVRGKMIGVIETQSM